MHRLVIHKLGPIKDCSLDCAQFMAFTGYQASGKSTIAKAIFYFRTIKDDIYTLAQEKALTIQVFEPGKSQATLKKLLIDHLREKFLRVFGSSWGMDNEMYMEYHYTDECSIRISLRESTMYSTPNYIWIDLSADLSAFIDKHDGVLGVSALGVPEIQRQKFQLDLAQFFDDKYHVVYIPAGRSMLTLLYQQLGYIYQTMKDVQKRTIDYCTTDYIERILSLKTEFSDGLEGLAARNAYKTKISRDIIRLALKLIPQILRGSYMISAGGEERIVFSGNRYVKLNFASSGQQESVWILNLLFYYLVQNEPILFIIEEPESHLFPESQKYITELISLVNNAGHSIVLTTHSPYVLGTLNNLLFAYQTPNHAISHATKIIPSQLWIKRDGFDAWFVKNSTIENCMDTEIDQIQNERIDEISKTINQDFDALLELQIED
jgi:energy-coupling factor transporter ATP-binding protein EcfA2